MDIERVDTFPFPTPPERVSLMAALKLLQLLEALEPKTQNITALGRTLSAFPVLPRFAKMLVLANQDNCLPYVIAVASSLSVRELWLQPNLNRTKLDHGDGKDEEVSSDDDDNDDPLRKEAKRKQQSETSKAMNAARYRWLHAESDLLTSLKLVGGFQYATLTNKGVMSNKRNSPKWKEAYQQSTVEFCKTNFLRLKAMQEVDELRHQLTRIAIDIVDDGIDEKKKPSKNAVFETKKNESKLVKSLKRSVRKPLPPPSTAQEIIIRQIICAG
jgi:ATP-dependent RNA helicase DHX37/DHR1